MILAYIVLRDRRLRLHRHHDLRAAVHGMTASLLLVRRVVAEPVDLPGTRCRWRRSSPASGRVCSARSCLAYRSRKRSITSATLARSSMTPSGARMLGEAGRYIANIDMLRVALLRPDVAGAGWYLVRRDRALILAFLTPRTRRALYLVVPGTRSSARLHCFLIIPAMMGLAVAVENLLCRGPFLRLLLACLAQLPGWRASQTCTDVTSPPACPT